MMRSWHLCGLLLAASLSAAPSQPEKLAGEDDKALPTPQPTFAADERGPVQVSRTAKAAASFDLPAFVITGGGERKVLATRTDLGLAVDTRGGIKASPGEAGAAKDQSGAGAEREGYEDLTQTGRSGVGRVRAEAGLARSYDLDAMAGLEKGPAFGWAQGWLNGTDGGEGWNGLTWKPGQRSSRGLDGRGGWRFGKGGSLALDAGASADEAFMAGVGILNGRQLQQARWKAGLDWDGPWNRFGTALKAGAYGGQAYDSARLGYQEEGAQGELRLEHPFQAASLSTMDELVLSLDSLNQRQRSVQLLSVEIWTRFEAVPHQRVGLGLGLDAALGDAHAAQLGPRAALEQPLGNQLALRARLGSGLALSRLGQGRKDQALWLPDPSLAPALWRLDASATLIWQPQHSLHAEVEGFYKDGQDQFLAASSATGGPAVDTYVGALRHWGLRLKQVYARGPWSQEAGVVFQRMDLIDRGAWVATYTPGWSAYLQAAGRWEPYGIELKAEALGPRDAALNGSLTLETSLDLSAKVSYRWRESTDFYLRGGNLASQRVQGLAGALEPAPYAGLGAERRF